MSGEWEGGGSLFERFDAGEFGAGGAGAGGAGAGGAGATAAGGGFQFGLPPFVPIRQLGSGNVSVAAGSEAAPQEESVVIEMPFRGWVANLNAWWEAGTNQLFGMQFVIFGPDQATRRLIPFNPNDSYISLNDANPDPFWLWLPAAEGQRFRLTVRNEDTQGHALPFIINVVQLTDSLEEALPPEVLPPEEPFDGEEGEA